MKESGYIHWWPICLLKAVTLWRIGPFRYVLFRDVSGKCYKEFAWFEWINNNEARSFIPTR